MCFPSSTTSVRKLVIGKSRALKSDGQPDRAGAFLSRDEGSAGAGQAQALNLSLVRNVGGLISE
jgi:hypothetical protein